uniref:Uncharacterized protein n=1 Tax=Tanacetum cinerariifolium TaxID=118510 RepID=A0A6L2J319_TANCI|nr:hypothetical protein [Tanacetum cinerariifolium]
MLSESIQKKGASGGSFGEAAMVVDGGEGVVMMVAATMVVPAAMVAKSGCAWRRVIEEDRLKLKELMKLCTKLSDRVFDLEKTKNAQAKEIANLKKKVKKLERNRRSRTPGIIFFKIGTSRKRSLGEDDASK